MNQIGNSPMIYLHIRIPEEMKESLQQLADADRRKFSDYIRIILEDHLQQKEHQAIKADMDAIISENLVAWKELAK